MPDSPPPSTLRKKEGWVGVAATAALCGLFLWWWFQPAPLTAENGRNPLYWIGLARTELGRAEPSLGMRLEVIMIAEALRERGTADTAEKIETDWLPPAWRTPAADPPPAAPPAELSPVISRLDEAATAFDTLEIERGAALLREAADSAAALPDPVRPLAVWLVAARQARNGLGTDAARTRDLLPPAVGAGVFPDWLVTEMLAGDIIAPVVSALSQRPADDPAVVAFATRWRAFVRQRFAVRENPLLPRHGPSTDASKPADDTADDLWPAVEANHIEAAGSRARHDPSAQLAIARLLIWLAAPAP